MVRAAGVGGCGGRSLDRRTGRPRSRQRARTGAGIRGSGGGAADRFQRQQDLPRADPAVLRAVAARLGALVRADSPQGEPATLAAQVAGPAAGAGLADAVAQLVKAITYPRLNVCRESYREVGPDGSCRRQLAVQARRRISGTHCVDCPHWLAFGPAEHEALAARGLAIGSSRVCRGPRGFSAGGFPRAATPAFLPAINVRLPST